MTGVYDGRVAVALETLGRQYLTIAALVGIAALVWRGGVRRYAAYGG